MQRNPINDRIAARLLSLMASALLLLLLVLPLMVLPLRQVIFLSQSGKIRQMEPNSAKLERMIFTTGEFARLNFVRSLREFIYLGNQYDVHSITRSGNQVLVVALWDSVETDMLQSLLPLDKQDSSTAPGVSKVGFMPYFQVNPFRPDFQTVFFDQPDNRNISLIYSDPLLRICSPPPELLTFLRTEDI